LDAWRYSPEVDLILSSGGPAPDRVSRALCALIS